MKTNLQRSLSCSINPQVVARTPACTMHLVGDFQLNRTTFLAFQSDYDWPKLRTVSQHAVRHRLYLSVQVGAASAPVLRESFDFTIRKSSSWQRWLGRIFRAHLYRLVSQKCSTRSHKYKLMVARKNKGRRYSILCEMSRASYLFEISWVNMHVCVFGLYNDMPWISDE